MQPKYLRAIALLLVLGTAVTVWAAEFHSGLAVGESIGAFDVVKVGGAVDDGVKDGTTLCYRCRYGAKPVAGVFARKVSPALLRLVRDLDKAVNDHEAQQLRSLVNLVGDERAKLETEAKHLARAAKVQHVAVVVPIESENGPPGVDLNPAAEVTVLLWREGTIAANYAFEAGRFSESDAQAVVASLEKILP